ncbi:MAG: nucleotidyltransferase [Bacteroidota bacterium]
MANNIFNQDFQDFLAAFDENGVEYVLIGGYSVILHGYRRTTGDLDVWVNRTVENYQKIVQSFRDFGMPVFDMTEEKFLSYPEVDVFSFGVSPVRIDLMTHAKGLDFEVAYSNSSIVEIEGLSVRLIDFDDLIKLKSASNRAKDQNDIEHLNRNKA